MHDRRPIDHRNAAALVEHLCLIDSSESPHSPAGVSAARASSLVLLLLSTACTGGKLVVLGTASPAPYHFHVPALVTELASPSRTDNPTLTGDMLEIYFTSNRDGGPGGGDIWVATRATTDAPFGTPVPVEGVNLDSFDTSSAISTDGLTLWFGSDRAGGLGAIDIWMSQRATRGYPWSTPLDLVGLNSTADDIPRPAGLHGTVMPMSSARNLAAPSYQTYFATREGSNAAFAMPVLIDGIDPDNRLTVDGFLTDDGLTLFYSAAPLVPPPGRDAGANDAAPPDAGTPLDASATPDAGPTFGTSDLFVAWRRSTDGPFEVTQALSDLNTSANERDPWLSPDGSTFFFTSDRDGAPNIYSVSVRPR
jgi:WD40-like Beta Propeller Repeat